MSNVGTRILLFLSSYFPLAVVFFILFYEQQRMLGIAILSVSLVGLVGLAIYLRMAQRMSSTKAKVVGLQHRDGEAMGYLTGYVIPFLGVPYNGWPQGLAMCIFFGVLLILYISSNMIHINPMLNLSGYHLYEITLEDGGAHALITRRRIVLGDSLDVVKIGDNILLEKK